MTLRDAAAAWWGWMAPLALQVTLPGLGALLLDAWLLRRAWPQLRLLLWVAVLAKALVPPRLDSPLAPQAAWLPTAPVVVAAPGWQALALAAWLLGLAGCLLRAAAVPAASRRTSAAQERTQPPAMAWPLRAATTGLSRPKRESTAPSSTGRKRSA